MNSANLSPHGTTHCFALSTWISKQHQTNYTVSETLIEDLDERSHHTSSTTGDNIPLFDTLFDRLDIIHTTDYSSDDAVPGIRDPPTPDFTPTFIKTRTETSTNIFDMSLTADNRNVRVVGEKMNIVDKEGNQPIPSDKPKPNEDNPTISNGIHMPMAQTKEQGGYKGKVASGESGEGEDKDKIDCGIVTMDERLKGVDEDRELMERTTRKHPKEQHSNGEGRYKVHPGTTDDTKSIWHLHTDQIRVSAKLILKLTDLGFPDFESVHLNSTILDEGIGGSESEGVDNVNNEADWATLTTTAISETKGQREVNPKEQDDAKSNPLPPIRDHFDFNDAELILMQMDLNATPLKSQHPCSLAEITKVENLPYQKDIEPSIYVPKGSN